MLPFMISIMTEGPMDQLILRLETLHRSLRNGARSHDCDRRVAESVAICLRDLHSLAARSVDGAGKERPLLRLVVGGARAPNNS